MLTASASVSLWLAPRPGRARAAFMSSDRKLAAASKWAVSCAARRAADLDCPSDEGRSAASTIEGVMSKVQLASYEDVPYESNPFPATHPGSLAVVALLLGMEPAPVDRCRVLELGCASGGNLIPMALTLPQSRFVGIDLSPRQVAAGQRRIEALDLSNIELKPLSILEMDDRFGQFDYIICHGVYSWVPAEVQEKILTICQNLLAGQGVAYVCYNTYPGWHLWALVRGMLSFHGAHFSDPPTRIRQTRAFLDLLAQAVTGSTELYARLLAEEVSELQKQQDSYLFHEHLEDVNTPTYFYQFAERAAGKG